MVRYSCTERFASLHSSVFELQHACTCRFGSAELALELYTGYTVNHSFETSQCSPIVGDGTVLAGVTGAGTTHEEESRKSAAHEEECHTGDRENEDSQKLRWLLANCPAARASLARYELSSIEVQAC